MMTKMDMRQSWRSNFGEKTEGATTESRERTAKSLFDNLGSVALVVEGSDFGTTEDRFEPTARCNW